MTISEWNFNGKHIAYAMCGEEIHFATKRYADEVAREINEAGGKAEVASVICPDDPDEVPTWAIREAKDGIQAKRG